MFQIELKPKLRQVSNNLTYPQTVIIFKVKEFRAPIRSDSVITAKISDTRPKIVRLKLMCHLWRRPLTQIEKKATKVC